MTPAKQSVSWVQVLKMGGPYLNSEVDPSIKVLETGSLNLNYVAFIPKQGNACVSVARRLR